MSFRWKKVPPTESSKPAITLDGFFTVTYSIVEAVSLDEGKGAVPSYCWLFPVRCLLSMVVGGVVVDAGQGGRGTCHPWKGGA